MILLLILKYIIFVSFQPPLFLRLYQPFFYFFLFFFKFSFFFSLKILWCHQTVLDCIFIYFILIVGRASPRVIVLVKHVELMSSLVHGFDPRCWIVIKHVCDSHSMFIVSTQLLISHNRSPISHLNAKITSAKPMECTFTKQVQDNMYYILGKHKSFQLGKKLEVNFNY